MLRQCAGIILIVLLAVFPGAFEAWAGENILADPAIGRLNHAGFKSRSHCTSFVIQDGPLITAFHCLPNIPKGTVHVLLGYELGRSEQHLQMPTQSYRTIPDRDIAALCGYSDPNHGFSLFQTSLDEGTEVTVRGYGTPRVHALQETTCTVKSTSRKSFVMLDCDLPPGTSGAPVTVANTRKIIGVVSASSPRGALVSMLDTSMLERLCQ